MSESCSCGSATQYDLCCGPYLAGEALPATPEQLMRSRYSAWVRHNVRYIIDSWHSSCFAERFSADITSGFASTYWLGLTILSSETSVNDNEGYVTFFARFRENERLRFIHERSRFLREDQRWYYIDGTFPAIGRNDPCPCGSGKKHKKCCSQA